ncbi:MAG: hypothetical protein AB7O64_14495, partial [Methylibium sp.]
RLILANIATLITPGSPRSFIEQGSVFAWVSFERSQCPQVGQFSVIVNTLMLCFVFSMQPWQVNEAWTLALSAPSALSLVMALVPWLGSSPQSVLRACWTRFGAHAQLPAAEAPSPWGPSVD